MLLGSAKVNCPACSPMPGFGVCPHGADFAGAASQQNELGTFKVENRHCPIEMLICRRDDIAGIRLQGLSPDAVLASASLSGLAAESWP
jgi:hypothetical protein